MLQQVTWKIHNRTLKYMLRNTTKMELQVYTTLLRTNILSGFQILVTKNITKKNSIPFFTCALLPCMPLCYACPSTLPPIHPAMHLLPLPPPPPQWTACKKLPPANEPAHIDAHKPDVNFYRPRSVASEGYVFTGVHVSFILFNSGGGGGEVVNTKGPGHNTPSPPGPGHNSPPPPTGLYAGGWYASYWNAFLLESWNFTSVKILWENILIR